MLAARYAVHQAAAAADTLSAAVTTCCQSRAAQLCRESDDQRGDPLRRVRVRFGRQQSPDRLMIGGSTLRG